MDLVDRTLAQERMIVRVCSLFGLLALLLASIGLYGVLAYDVSRRSEEIGIRVALGARGSDVRWMVLRETTSLVILGLALGWPAVLGTTRFVSSLLFELSPVDPWAILVSALVLLCVAFAAGFVPAYGASRLDPLTVLRYE